MPAVTETWMRLTFAAALWATVGCSSRVPADNPFDSEGTGTKHDGSIVGRILVSGAISQVGWEISLSHEGAPIGTPVLSRESDPEAARIECRTNSGCFDSPGIPPGFYTLKLANPPVANLPVGVDDIEVLPGSVTDVGVLMSARVPPTGQISGTVVINDDGTAPLSGVDLILTRREGTPTASKTTQTDENGVYTFTELLPGEYEIRATRAGFTPDLTDWTVQGPQRAVEPRPLVLYPASGVVRIFLPGSESVYPPFVNVRDVTLEMLAFGGTGSDLLEMRYGESPDLEQDAVAPGWMPHLGQLPHTLSAGEGSKTVYAQFRLVRDDGSQIVERLRTEVYDASIVYDATPPAIVSWVVAPNAVTVGTDRYLTTADKGTVSVEVVAFDPYSKVAGFKVIPQGADPKQVTYDARISSDATVTYFTSVAMSPGDGNKTVSLQIIDRAGNETTLAEASLLIDGTPPIIGAGNFVVNSDAPWTSRAIVNLTINAIDANPIVALYVSNDATLAGAVPIPLVGTLQWQLATPSIDQTKTVFVKVVDAAGNEALAQDSIDYDATPPSVSPTLFGLAMGGVDSSSVTRSATVRVELDANDSGGNPSGLVDMMISNKSDFSDVTWAGGYQASTAGHALAASTQDGSKSVFVRVKDLAGNVTAGQVTIVLDTRAPTGTVTLQGGALSITDESNVSASLVASADVAKMALVSGSLTAAQCAAEDFVDFNPNQSFSFGTGLSDGTLTLSACLQDGAGNITATEDAILLDKAPPSGTLTLNGGASFTNNATVNASLSATDATSGVADVRLANDTTAILGAQWQTLESVPATWLLQNPGDQGLKNVVLQVRDKAGNTSGFIVAAITLDTLAPVGTISVVGGNTNLQSASVSLEITRNSDANVTQMAIAQGALACAGADYVAYEQFPATLQLNGEGLQTLSLCLRDLARNTAGLSTTVTVDLRNPTGTMVINGGATFATGSNATLAINASSDVTGMKIVGDPDLCTTHGDYGAFDMSPAVNLGATPGSVTVRVCIHDASERYAILTDSVILDTVGPLAPTIEIEGGATITSNTTVNVTIGATDTPAGVVEYKLSDGSGCAGGTWQLFDDLSDGVADNKMIATWTLQGGDGVSRTVSVLFRDAAGNAGAVCQPDSIDVDTVGPDAPAVTIVKGAAAIIPGYTNDEEVALNLFAVDADRFEASTDPVGFQGFATATAFATSAQFCLGGGAPTSCTDLDGVDEDYTVYVRYYDTLGNPSAVAHDVIALDTVAPSGEGITITEAGPVLTSGGIFYTRSEIINVEPLVDAELGLQMQLGSDSTLDSEPWLEYAPSLQFVLSSTDCVSDVCTIQGRYRDLAGNVTLTTPSVDIILDTAPPVAPKVVRASEVVTDTAYAFEIVAGIVSDAHFSHFEIKGGQYGAFAQVSTDSNETQFPVTLTANEINTLRVRAVDKAGNISSDDFSLVTHDNEPPVRPSGVIVEAFDNELRLSWIGSVSPDVAYYKLHYGTISETYIGTGAAEGDSPINVGQALSFNLTGVANNNDVYIAVSAVDLAGNESGLSSEAVAAPAPFAPKLISQVGGTIARVWANPATDHVFVPFDGGLKVIHVVPSGSPPSYDVVGLIPDLPDATQVLFDNDSGNGWIFVHSSDPELGPVPENTNDMAIFRKLPNERAPVRTLTTIDGSTFAKVETLPLDDGTLFFELMDDGAGTKKGVSSTLGIELMADDPPDFNITASQLSYWSYDSASGRFSLESSTAVNGLTAWAVDKSGRYLITNEYPTGFYKTYPFLGLDHFIRVVDPFASPVTAVGAVTIKLADDGVAVTMGQIGRAEDLLLQLFPGDGMPLAAIVDIADMANPVSYGHYMWGGDPLDPAPGIAQGGSTTMLVFQQAVLGSVANTAASPALVGHTLTLKGSGETVTITSYTLPGDGSDGTFTFDPPAAQAVATGDAYTLEIEPLTRLAEGGSTTTLDFQPSELGSILTFASPPALTGHTITLLEPSETVTITDYTLPFDGSNGTFTFTPAVAAVVAGRKYQLHVDSTETLRGTVFGEDARDADPLIQRPLQPQIIGGHSTLRRVFLVQGEGDADETRGYQDKETIHEYLLDPAGATYADRAVTAKDGASNPIARTFSSAPLDIQVYPNYLVILFSDDVLVLPLDEAGNPWQTASGISIPLGTSHHQLYVKDGYVYTASRQFSGADRINIIDATDPFRPRTLSNTVLNTASPVLKIRGDGNRLYVLEGACGRACNGGAGHRNCDCTGAQRLTTFTLSDHDMTDPARSFGGKPRLPTQVDSVPIEIIEAGPVTVQVNGIDDIVPWRNQILAYANHDADAALPPDKSYLLRLWGQSEGKSPGTSLPSSGVPTAHIDLGDAVLSEQDYETGAKDPAFAIATSGRYIFVNRKGGGSCGSRPTHYFEALRVSSDDETAVVMSVGQTVEDCRNAVVRDMTVAGDYLYVFSSGNNGGLRVIDVAVALRTDTAAGLTMNEVGSWVADGVQGGVVAGAYAYAIVAQDRDRSVAGVRVIDITTASAPKEIHNIRVAAEDIVVDGGLMYMTTRNSGLRIYELMRRASFRSGPAYYAADGTSDVGTYARGTRRLYGNGANRQGLSVWNISTTEAVQGVPDFESNTVRMPGGYRKAYGDDELWAAGDPYREAECNGTDCRCVESDCGCDGSDSDCISGPFCACTGPDCRCWGSDRLCTGPACQYMGVNSLSVYDLSYLDLDPNPTNKIMTRAFALAPFSSTDPIIPFDEDKACTDSQECCGYQACYEKTPPEGMKCHSGWPRVLKVVRGPSTLYFALVTFESGQGGDERQDKLGPNSGIYVFTKDSVYTSQSLQSGLLAGVTTPATSCTAERPGVASINDILWSHGVLYTLGTSIAAMHATAPSHASFLDWAGATKVVPQSPTLNATSCGRGMFAAGNYLYVLGDEIDALDGWRNSCDSSNSSGSDESRMMWIFDITDPMVPTEVGFLDLTQKVNARFVVDGNTAYIGQQTPERILVLDVSDRTAPYVSGAFNMPGTNLEVDIHGPHLYVHGGATGINVLDGR